MKKLTFVLALFIIIPSFLLAQRQPLFLPKPEMVVAGMSGERLALLDRHIEKFIAEGNLPGGVFMIVRKGKTVYNKSFGYQDLSKKEPYREDNIFRLASMTKAFTAVSILQLYENGQLGLDDPIHYYIPSFANAAVLDQFNEADSSFTTIPVKNPITIRHLLTHTSGITYGTFNPGKIQAVYKKMNANGFGLSHAEMTTEQMANQIAKVPLVFEPGEKYMYGLSMEVLGRIVEVVSEKPLDQYFQDHIFEPLNMNDTYFYLPESKHDRLVPVYTYDENKKFIMASDTPFGPVLEYPKAQNRNHFAGGGGLSGTAGDYIKFIRALLNNGAYAGERILSRKSIEMMTSDQLIRLNEKGTGYSSTPGITYGLGFALTTEEGRAVSHKSAGTYEWSGYFNTRFFIDPEEEMIFVGMTQVVPFARGDFWEKATAIIYGAID